jgi:hypothetical protein
MPPHLAYSECLTAIVLMSLFLQLQQSAPCCRGLRKGAASDAAPPAAHTKSLTLIILMSLFLQLQQPAPCC